MILIKTFSTILVILSKSDSSIHQSSDNIPDLSNSITINGDDFIDICKTGKLEVAKWLYDLKGINIHTHAINDHAFFQSCVKGHIEVAKWLYSLGGIDIYVVDDHAFCSSCMKGQIEVAKWLLSIKPSIDITANKDYAFKNCIKNNFKYSANWLVQQLPNRYILHKLDDKIIGYQIKK